MIFKNKIELTFKIYNRLVSQLVFDFDNKNLDIEDLLHRVEKIAYFATIAPPGLLGDFRLEKIIHSIGKQYFSVIERRQQQHSYKNILHIGTTFYDFGGHTRIVKSWINQDQNNKHSLILTNQTEPIESSFFDKTSLMILKPDSTHLEKSKKIYDNIKLKNYDLIILHIHPSDVTSLLAVSNVMTPTILYNHSDHTYWLGVSFVNIIADFARKHMKVTKNYRHGNSVFLPQIFDNVTFISLEKKRKMRHELHKKLQISTEKVLVTMGSPYKYKPSGKYDFFGFFNNFLNKHSDVVLLVIGMDYNQYKRFSKRNKLHKNIYLLGSLVDPSEYLLAGDLFVESYPIGSGGSTILSLFYGMIPIFNYGNGVTIYGNGVADLFFDFTELIKCSTREEYYSLLEKLLYDKSTFYKIHNKRREHLAKFTPPTWNKYLSNLYEVAISHEKKIPLSNKVSSNFDDNHERFNSFQLPTSWRLYKRYTELFESKIDFITYLNFVYLFFFDILYKIKTNRIFRI